jgi:hypothetical protein
MSSFVANDFNKNHLSKEQDLKRSNLQAVLEESSGSAPACLDEDSDVEQGNVENEAMKATRRSSQWNDLIPKEQAGWNEVAELLDKREPSVGILRKEEIQKLATVKNEEGVSLLWVAVDSEAPLNVVQLLLDADKENQHLYDAKVLTKIIEHYLVLLIRGSFNEDSEAHQQVIAQEWMDKYLAKPLLCYILDASTASRRGKVHKSNGAKIQVPHDVYPYISKSVTSSTELQEQVNRQTIKRSVLSILFLDLYAHIAVITLFCLYTNLYLEDIRDFQGYEIEASAIGGKDDTNYALGLVILAGYFAGRIIVEMMSIGSFWGYLFDWWTLFKLSRLVSLVVTVRLMEGGITSDDRNIQPETVPGGLQDVQFVS